METIYSTLGSEADLADRWRAQALAEIAAMDEDEVVAERLGLASSGLDRLLVQPYWDLKTAFRVLTLLGVTPTTEPQNG